MMNPCAVDFYTSLPAFDAPNSSHAFALRNAQVIAAAIDSLLDKELCLRAYTPPFEAPLPDGFLELCFGDRKKYSIGLTFGSFESLPPFDRSDFNAEQWRSAPEDPFSSALLAASFDEAWRIVCLVAKLLAVERITIAYGF